MKDFVGNEPHIGNKVVDFHKGKCGIDMIKTEVIGFTEFMVKVKKMNPCAIRKYSVVSPMNYVQYVALETEVV